MWTLYPLIILSIILGIGAWLLFMWSVKSGQYDDVEGPKHRMLDDDDEEESKPNGGENDGTEKDVQDHNGRPLS